MIPCPSPEERCPRDRWKHGVLPVLGLIGGIGGGKSAVARLLAGRGAAVIDADAVGHERLEDPAIRERVVGRFGAGVLEMTPSGDAEGPRISRRALAAIVFGDAAALRDLEAILHPAMRDRFVRTIDRLVREGGRPCIVLDAAVLLEAGWDDLCDRIAFVDAPRPERLRRVEQARGWSEATFESRERSQWPAEEKRRRADWIVSNDGGPDHLEAEVERLAAWLHAAAPTGAMAIASTSERGPARPMPDERAPRRRPPARAAVHRDSRDC
jgi:dephospho-CoA kinase